MKAKTFIRALNFICPINNKTAKRWVAWSKNLEWIDRSGEAIPLEPYKTAGIFRKEILSLLSDIIRQYGTDIAAKVISACPFPSDIHSLAYRFAKSGSVQDTDTKKSDGSHAQHRAHTRTIRSNIKSDSVYSPQNYLCAVTGHCYSFLLEPSIRKQVEQILIHHRLPHVSFALSEAQDALRTGAPMVLVDCSDYLEDEVTGELRAVKDLRWFRVPDDFTDEE